MILTLPLAIAPSSTYLTGALGKRLFEPIVFIGEFPLATC